MSPRPEPRSFRRPSPTSTRSGSEASVDSKNPERGPLLIIAGERDNTIPLAITQATYKLQSKHNSGITEIAKVPGRGGIP